MQTSPSIVYRVQIDPARHQLEVEMLIHSTTRSLRLEVATWVPGSYRFRTAAKDILIGKRKIFKVAHHYAFSGKAGKLLHRRRTRLG